MTIVNYNVKRKNIIYLLSNTFRSKCVSSDNFIELYNSSKESDIIITNYRMRLHEFNNKLLTIKGMLKNEETVISRYIDKIIESNTLDYNDSYPTLDYLKIPALKFFLGNKINKLKSEGANVELFVSKEVMTISSIYNDTAWHNIYTILGVILDNMIEALKHTEEKEASMQIYLVNDILNMEFANTFTPNDNDKLLFTRYTSKNIGHGMGLCLVKKIIKKCPYCKLDTKIIDNFFVEHLTINLTKMTENH